MRNNNMNTPDCSVRMLSWNVKGLNSPVKRCRVFNHIKTLKADIIFLQETHLKNEDHKRLKNKCISQIYHSKFNSRARGVAILINNKIQFTVSEIKLDVNGRYIIISGILFQTPVLLVNVYAPNWDDIVFMNRLLASLPDLNTHKLIFGGDLNLTINPILDRSNPKNSLSKTLCTENVQILVNIHGRQWMC